MGDLNASTSSVTSFITYLRNPGKGSDATAANLLESLLAEREALAAKLAEAERERDRLKSAAEIDTSKEAVAERIADWDVYGIPNDAEPIALVKILAAKHDKIKAERDAAWLALHEVRLKYDAALAEVEK